MTNQERDDGKKKKKKLLYFSTLKHILLDPAYYVASLSAQ